MSFYFVFDSYEAALECLPAYESDKGKALLLAAAENVRREQESFERSDTDGCVSQWCHSIGAEEKRREAALADQGYMVIRPALLDIASGQIVAGLLWMDFNKFAGYGHVWRWHVVRDNPLARQWRGVEYVSDYKRESGFEKIGLRKVWVMAPGKMYSQRPGDTSEPPRGLSGLASYSGKHADIDYEASGLPM